jgi:hypothetical protein
MASSSRCGGDEGGLFAWGAWRGAQAWRVPVVGLGGLAHAARGGALVWPAPFWLAPSASPPGVDPPSPLPPGAVPLLPCRKAEGALPQGRAAVRGGWRAGGRPPVGEQRLARRARARAACAGAKGAKAQPAPWALPTLGRALPPPLLPPRPDPAVLAAREALRLEEAEVGGLPGGTGAGVVARPPAVRQRAWARGRPPAHTHFALTPPHLTPHPTHPSTPHLYPSPQGPASPLDLRIKILVIGLAGSGKTQLIRSLLGGPLAGGCRVLGGGGGRGAARGEKAGAWLGVQLAAARGSRWRAGGPAGPGPSHHARRLAAPAAPAQTRAPASAPSTRSRAQRPRSRCALAAAAARPSIFWRPTQPRGALCCLIAPPLPPCPRCTPPTSRSPSHPPNTTPRSSRAACRA